MDFSNLNPVQKSIVTSNNRVIIVNAGPGTGKTKTLTNRIAYLMHEKNVQPRHIAAITFTNRAAEEMQNRLMTMTPQTPTVSTFHGFCYALLVEWGIEVALLSNERQQQIVQELLQAQKTKKSISIRAFIRLVSSYKNGFRTSLHAKHAGLIERYNRQLASANLVDYDDLLLLTLSHLTMNDNLRQRVRERMKHMFIDEFQDTNEMQYNIVQSIIGLSGSLFAIGDPLQSIYSFRGSLPGIFDRLKADYPDTFEATLNINYRSGSRIIAGSSALFSDAVIMRAGTERVGDVTLFDTLDEYTEAEWIVSCINKKIGGSELLTATDDGADSTIDFSDFAIIFRTHRAAHALEKTLSRSGLPYQIVHEDTVPEGDRIKILSMHAAKGLEFEYVFVCGFEDGLIPYHRAAVIDEEKRLLYVAMTRAKKELFLSVARQRNRQKTVISPFYTLLQHSLPRSQDPHIKKVMMHREKKRLKKSQISLF